MSSTRMKVKDLQFARYFLTNEVDLKKDLIDDILEYDIEIKSVGEPDTVIDRGNALIVHSPSSLTRLLFNVLYNMLSKHVRSDIYRDKLGLGLLFMCKNYVYADYEPREITGPPVLIDFEKLSVPKFVIKEIVEPLVGLIRMPPVFFIKCKFTDVCREIQGSHILTEQYNLPRISVPNSDFPIILCNSSVQNSPAEASHLIVKCMEMSLGEGKAHRVLRNILTDESGNIMTNLVLILKTLRSEPDFMMDFLKYLGSNIILTGVELDTAEKVSLSAINGNNLVEKFARENTNTQIFKQWSQWSMLMGLIEKQLTPMRGSMWPASETIKPFEDAIKARQKEMATKKGKNQLNFEELLESYRDTFNHKAVEPGKILEYMMKDNRVWK